MNDSPTAQELLKQLPIESQVNTWGDEIYFEIPVNMSQEPDAREFVKVGDLGYWPVGQAFCIFFGPTPVSTDQQPRAFSSVNILGEILGDSQCLRAIKDHDRVKLSDLMGNRSLHISGFSGSSNGIFHMNHPGEQSG